MSSASLWATALNVSIPTTTTVAVGGTVTITGTAQSSTPLNPTASQPNLTMQWEYNSGTPAAPVWVFITGTTPVCMGTAPTTCTSTVTITGVASTGSNNASNNAFVTGTQLNLQAADAVPSVAVSATGPDTLTVVPTGTWYKTFATSTAGLATSTSERSVLLENGDVMATGYGATATINLYNASANTWVASAAPLSSARLRPTVTLLPTGSVLIAGGATASGSQKTVDLFTEGTPAGTGDTDTATGGTMNMGTARDSHVAALLTNGTVLIAGGNNDGQVLNTAEIYNILANTWSATGSMTTARARAAATVLSANGTVLVSGGQSASGATGALASAEIYNPLTNTWTATCPMNVARYFHTSTQLTDGTVLITGGIDANNHTLSSAEIFDPNGVNGTTCTGTFTLVSGAMVAGRSEHTATLQANGTVLISGGASAGAIVKTAEIYAGGGFTATGTMNTARDAHAAVLIDSGDTLIIGGTTTTGANLAAPEYYVSTISPAIPTVTVTANNAGLAQCIAANLTGDNNVVYNWYVTGAGAQIISAYGNSPTIYVNGATTGVTCMVTSGYGISVFASATPSVSTAAGFASGFTEKYTSTTQTSQASAPTYAGNSYVLAGQTAYFSITTNGANTSGVTWMFYNTATSAWTAYPSTVFTQPSSTNAYVSTLTIPGVTAASNGLKILAVAALPANVTAANATLLPTAQTTLNVYSVPAVTLTSALAISANAGTNVKLIGTVTGSPVPDSSSFNTNLAWQQCTPRATTPVETCAASSSGWANAGLTPAASVTITGGISSTLTLTSVQAAQNGVMYRLIAGTIGTSNNSTGTNVNDTNVTAGTAVASSATVLTVYTQPVIATNPGYVYVYANNGTTQKTSAIFTVTVNSADSAWDTPNVVWAYQVGSNLNNPNGQWKIFPASVYSPWNSLTGKSSLTVLNPQSLSANLNVKACVTNSYTAAATATGGGIVAGSTCGSTATYLVASTAATLDVITDPTTTADGTVVLSGNKAAFNVPTTGTATSLELAEGVNETFTITPPAQSPYTYTCQWYNGATKLVDVGGHIAGSATCALTITGTKVTDVGTYTAQITAASTDVNASPFDETDTAVFTSTAVPLSVELGDWTPAVASIAVDRYEALSALLPNGNFWIGGGIGDNSVIVESSDVFTPTAAGQVNGSATVYPLLDNGGGANDTVATAGKPFTTVPHLNGTATVMPNGSILVAGGYSFDWYATNNIDIYVPAIPVANDSVGAAAVTLDQPTAGQSAVLLASGLVLLAGGTDGSGDLFYNNSYLYNPSTGTFSARSSQSTMGSMVTARAYATTSLLPTGNVLIAGGQVPATTGGGVTNAAELFVPTASPAGFIQTEATATNTAVAQGVPQPMQSPRIYHTATVIPPTLEMPQGAVILAGGMDNNGNVLSSVEVYDVYTGSFYNLGNLSVARMMHSATLLHNASAACTTAPPTTVAPYTTALPPISCYKVLISGGQNAGGILDTNDTINVAGVGTTFTTANYIAEQAAPVPTMAIVSTYALNDMSDYRSGAATTLLPNGAVLTVGGQGYTGNNPANAMNVQNTAEYFGAIGDYTDQDTLTAAFTGVTAGMAAPSQAAGVTVTATTTNNTPNTLYYWIITNGVVTGGTATTATGTSVAITPTSGQHLTVTLFTVDEYGVSKTVTVTVTAATVA